MVLTARLLQVVFVEVERFNYFHEIYVYEVPIYGDGAEGNLVAGW
jgi:hypothetical protein